MRRGLLTIIAASVLVALVPDATVLADFGYVDHGTDPDDVSATGQRVDIRATTRKVSQDGAGKRWLSITIRSHDPLDDGNDRFWEVEASIDSYGGPVRDSRVRFTQFEGDRWCNWTDGDRGWIAPLISQAGERVTCRIPLRFIEPRKRIRWRLTSPNAVRNSDEHDRAPDAGWYS